MRFGIVSLLIFFSFTNLHAEGTAVDRVHNSCIKNINWSKKQCELLYSEQYDQGLTAETVGVLFDLTTEPITEFVSKLGNIKDYLLDNDSTPITHQNVGAKIRQSIILELQNKIAKEKLNECQKACIIKCASANILSFSELVNTDDDSIEQVYSVGAGKCTEYSRIAKDLGLSLGIKTALVSNFSTRHRYNEFKINNRWYYGEPQSEKCQFYLKDKPSIGEVSSKDYAINGEQRSEQKKTIPVKFIQKSQNFSSTMKY